MDLFPNPEKDAINYTPNVASTEYLSGGFFLDSQKLLALSYQSDKMSRLYGDEIINDMRRDPEIYKCETVLKVNVLSDGIKFYPPVVRPPKPPIKKAGETPEQAKRRQKLEIAGERYKLAKSYSDFLNRSLKKLEKPLPQTLEMMLDGLFYGNKVAEKTFEETIDKVYDPETGKTTESKQFIIKSFRVKSRESINFVVDRFKKVWGIRGIAYVNKQRRAVTLPRKKFMIFTWDERDEDPRGTSKLEAVYNTWYLKTLLLPQWLKWLEQCAIPGLVGTMPEGYERKQIINPATGAPMLDSDRQPIYKDDAVLMLESLTNMRSSSVMVIPHGAEVKPISSQVSGDPFKSMLDALNKEMEQALILQTLATSDSRHNTRAASEVHATTLDSYVWHIKQRIMSVVTEDYIKPMMDEFAPDYDLELLPLISMSSTSRKDWSTDLSAVSGAVRDGFVSKSQFPGLDEEFGFPERDEEVDDEAVQALEEAQATPEPAPKPSPTPQPKGQ